MKWSHCPECGCTKYTNKNELGIGYRVCEDCGQEWWTTIDYDNISEYLKSKDNLYSYLRSLNL